ncbi:synaptonemal complex protein 2 [Erinaceus europaeus]|uniref:Synaptonemal complex protein 2 n=1 Tax=Erinaceus europaeus TaxID=9365 RepID=A0ABM3WJP8_ERIEU|nr:synaptonemal complex protein 2 [Erinaceus europaeus]XP_060036792.1 synaptonemal complex protein 2 [Erinaceus europaeus]
MPVRPDLQHLEKCIDDALRKNDFKPLKTLLHIDICEDVNIKCSKQFLYKLDDLICRELIKKDAHTVSAILVSIGRYGKNITILGQAGFLTMIKQGLVQKMVSWFEKSKEIILSRGNSKDETVLNMVEDLFDLLMIIHDISDEGKRQVLEKFIPQLCTLVIDSRVNICIQQEALKKMNTILDKMPQDNRKMFSNQEMLNLMSNMGERILDAGDYDLQVGIVEALCRMTTEKQRQELACNWFSMDFIADEFKSIKDSEFETDCRLFLNLINGMLGQKRRVFTFPCISAFLDKHELKIPSDERLEEFWIDFNLGSQTLSFYISGDNDDHQWEAVTVPEEIVQLYSIEVRESKKLLTIILKNVVTINKRAGKKLLLYFDASLEITNVTQKIFGTSKHREFTRKQGISVAKTSVHILFDASGSQILLPESQMSPVKGEQIGLKEKPNLQKEIAKPMKYSKNCNQEDKTNSQLEIITPSKRKMSEASMIVPGADRYTVRSPILLVNTSTPRRRRIKPPLPMMSSADKPDVSKTLENAVDNAMSVRSRPSKGTNQGNNIDKHIRTAHIVETAENKDSEFSKQSFNELQNIVSESQAKGKTYKPELPAVSEGIRGSKMHSKWSCWTPVTNINLCNKGANTSTGDTFNDDVINKKFTRQKSSSSISDNSEEIEKAQCTKEIMKPNQTDKAEVEVYNRSIQQQLDHPKHLEQKDTGDTKQSDWHIESETTFKSVLLNNTVEESLIYRKKFILSKDVNTAVYDKSPSRKNKKNPRKSRKGLTSEIHSWNLKQTKKREEPTGKGLTDATESLINQINKRYKPVDDTKSTRKLKEALIDGDFPNKPDLQLSKGKVQKKSYRQLKTTLVNVTSECPLDDVYNFNVNGADEPVIKLGIQEFQATEASMDNSVKFFRLSSRSQDEIEPSVKTKDKRIIANDKKKNLFSDNDTEYKYDDSKTDVSWLREPKSKPQLIDYSRNKKKKHNTRKSKSYSEKGQPTSKMTPNKNITKKVDETVPEWRTRLPRRTTKTKKNYKDLSNSESEDEQEFPHSVKEKLLVKEESIHSRSNTMELPKKQNTLSIETQKEVSKEWKNTTLVKDTLRDNSLDLSPISLSGSPSSIEVMRSIEKVTEMNFTEDYDHRTKSLSPCQKTSSCESLNNKYGVDDPIKSPQNTEKNVLCTRENSPMLQALSLENSLQSSSSMSSEGEERVWCGMLRETTHVSGPSHLNRKRMYTEDNQSGSEVELEEEERVNLLPKRLSKTEDAGLHAYKMSENISTLSKKNICTPEEKQQSQIFQLGERNENFSTKFQRRIDVRQKILDYFSKQSWKTAHQHLKKMNHQIQDYRMKRLDKFQYVILEELEKLEKDTQSLKDLEKEFVDVWGRILHKFTAYQKSEHQRLRVLKASLDQNVFPNTDYEETICTSEMNLLKEDMKMLQDKLLKEMQEEDLLTVRRGLMSLFMTQERNLCAI